MWVGTTTCRRGGGVHRRNESSPAVKGPAIIDPSPYFTTVCRLGAYVMGAACADAAQGSARSILDGPS
jgi:hypothetical protein